MQTNEREKKFKFAIDQNRKLVNGRVVGSKN